jgi:hypothetical protein
MEIVEPKDTYQEIEKSDAEVSNTRLFEIKLMKIRKTIERQA